MIICLGLLLVNYAQSEHKVWECDENSKKECECDQDYDCNCMEWVDDACVANANGNECWFGECKRRRVKERKPVNLCGENGNGICMRRPVKMCGENGNGICMRARKALILLQDD